MNFLEKIVAEQYEYKGYFVRTNDAVPEIYPLLKSVQYSAFYFSKK